MRYLLSTLFSCLLPLALTAAAPAAATATAAPAKPTPGSPLAALAPVPSPSLEALEPAVRDQLAALRTKLDQAVASGGDALALADVYGETGGAYLAYHLSEPAIACFKNAALLAPPQFRWHYLLGFTYQEMGDLAAAAEHYLSALERNPRYAAAYVRLGEVELARARLADAARMFDRALSAKGTDAAAHYGLGRVAAAMKQPAEAVKHFEQALALAPEASVIHYPLAQALRELGKVEQAKQHLAKRGDAQVFLADPLVKQLDRFVRNPQLLLTQAALALRDGKVEEAEKHFKTVLEGDPTNADALAGVGQIAAARGDLAAASKTYAGLVAAHPDDARAHAEYGDLLVVQGALEQAEREIRRATELAPQYIAALLAHGAVLARLGRFADAEQRFSAVLALDPTAQIAHEGRARALLRQGKEAEAKARLEESVKLLPTEGTLLHLLARLLATASQAELRDGQRAFELAARVFTADPIPDHGETLAMAFAEQGRFADAVDLERQVIDTLNQKKAPEAALRRAAKRLELYTAGKPCRTPWLD